MKFDKTISIIMIVLLVAAVGVTVYIIVKPNPSEKFTELYILGTGDKAGNYPTNLSVNETANVTVGIVNHEQVTTTYTMITTLNGETISNKNYTLLNNETRMINYSFMPTEGWKSDINF